MKTRVPGLFLFGALCLSHVAGLADETPTLSEEALVARAESALQWLYFQYDRSRDVLVERTNQMARVVFPRYYFRGQSPTNGPDHAAVVWLDERSGDVLPNPGLVPLSDGEAVQIARDYCRPEIFEYSSSNQVHRTASLTVVSVYPQPRPIPGGDHAARFPSFFIWIDTETKFPYGVMMAPN